LKKPGPKQPGVKLAGLKAAGLTAVVLRYASDSKVSIALQSHTFRPIQVPEWLRIVLGSSPEALAFELARQRHHI
jgi:hypothetical protein